LIFGGKELNNIETSRVFFGLVLENLQDAFPAAVTVNQDGVWEKFEALAPDGVVCLQQRRSYRTISTKELSAMPQLRSHYIKQMLMWMQVEGFLHRDPTNPLMHDYVLSSQALRLLDLNVAETEVSVGASLKNLLGGAVDAATGEIVSRIIGSVFGAVQGAAP